MPVDAIVGARYYDQTLGKEFVVEGIYERTVRDESGSIQGTEVIVDALYENAEDPTRIELDLFKNDPGIELLDVPEWI